MIVVPLHIKGERHHPSPLRSKGDAGKRSDARRGCPTNQTAAANSNDQHTQITAHHSNHVNHSSDNVNLNPLQFPLEHQGGGMGVLPLGHQGEGFSLEHRGGAPPSLPFAKQGDAEMKRPAGESHAEHARSKPPLIPPWTSRGGMVAKRRGFHAAVGFVATLAFHHVCCSHSFGRIFFCGRPKRGRRNEMTNLNG